MQTSEAEKVSVECFLHSEPENYRYEKNGHDGKFRLFHCKPDGTTRFAIYFGNPSKTDDNPYVIEVELSNVELSAQKIQVLMEIKNGAYNHYPANETNINIRAIADKICNVLNAHQVYNNIIP